MRHGCALDACYIEVILKGAVWCEPAGMYGIMAGCQLKSDIQTEYYLVLRASRSRGAA